MMDDADNRFTVTKDAVGGYWLSTTSKIINYEESTNYSVIVKTTDNGVPQQTFTQKIYVQVSTICHSYARENAKEVQQSLVFLTNIKISIPNRIFKSA